MTLRTRLLIAQAPLALALAAGGGPVGRARATPSGRAGRAHPHRQLPQRARRAADEGVASSGIDSARSVRGHRRARPWAGAAPRSTAPRSSASCRCEERNITEPGRGEAARRLREAWTEYQRRRTNGSSLRPRRSCGSATSTPLQPGFAESQGRRRRDPGHSTRTRWCARAPGCAGRPSGWRPRWSSRCWPRLVLALLASAALTSRRAAAGRGARPVGPAARSGRLCGRAVRVTEDGGSEIAQLAERLQRHGREPPALPRLEPGRAARGAARGAGHHRQPSRSGPGVRRRGERGQRQPRRGAASSASGRGRTPRLGRASPAVRERVERIRDEVLAGAGTDAAARVRGGAAGRVERREPGGCCPGPTGVRATRASCSGPRCVLQDVTRLRRFDELKNDLVATVAHEFRTPLTCLRMAIHLLRRADGGAAPETSSSTWCPAAREECERLQGIVDDLLDLARIRSGRLELHPREVSTELLLEQARHDTRDASDQRQIPVDVDIQPGAEVVMADPDRIDLALTNLIANAVRHGPPGRPVVVRAMRADGGVRIEVRDDGPGIAPEHQSRLFEKFYRVPGSPPGGAGLGLSIVRDVVEAHGGKVGVKSAPGAGTMFWVELPDSPTGVGGPAVPAQRPELSRPAGHPRTSSASARAWRRRSRGCAPPRRAWACWPSPGGCARARSARG